MSRNHLRGRLNRGELILLDGAMGTELERRGIQTPLPLWSAAALRDQPDMVREIHEEYVRAGADVITASTFRTTPRTMRKAGRDEAEARVLTQRAVALAGEATDRARGAREVLVAGALAPLEDCYRPDQAPDPEQSLREHTEQASFLARCGVDLILAETMNSVAEAMAAVRGAKATELPVLVSFVCRDGRELLSGESLADAVRAVEPLSPARDRGRMPPHDGARDAHPPRVLSQRRRAGHGARHVALRFLLDARAFRGSGGDLGGA